MYTSSAAAKSENADPSSASSRLKASQAKPAPIAKAVICTTRKNSVGRSLIQLPHGMCSSLSFGVEGVCVAQSAVLTRAVANGLGALAVSCDGRPLDTRGPVGHEL